MIQWQAAGIFIDQGKRWAGDIIVFWNVEAFRQTDRLSESERAMLMGGACAKAYGWSPKKGEVICVDSRLTLIRK